MSETSEVREGSGGAGGADPTAPAWVLHVDLDEFLAAVEVGRRPELRGKPVVVGGKGDPTQRAVVATASYEARAFGIRSGMPLRTAARLCPDAVFLPSDRPAYEEASELVMEALRTLPVIVEVLGWDEAFLGARTNQPEALAVRIRQTVLDATGLSCAVGIGDTRLRAKVATGFAKPGGIHRLTRHNWMATMGERPTDALWGIGAKTCRKLADLGIGTVVELARADPDALAARFGPTLGPWYRVLAFGAGDARVTADPYQPKSRSRETTFQHDVGDRAELDDQLVELAHRVADDVGDEGRPAVRVGVKVRFVPFFTQTRSVGLDAPTFAAADIEQAARTALDRFEDLARARPVRLLGVRAELAPPQPAPQPAPERAE
ncbi:MAG TPA: DNA polymerase IV [Acidimicrobiales bacterium]|nr:DNA polymerase IV [Acidimicrobiales bacterium]